jgi:hypothetical protein
VPAVIRLTAITPQTSTRCCGQLLARRDTVAGGLALVHESQLLVLGAVIAGFSAVINEVSASQWSGAT